MDSLLEEEGGPGRCPEGTVERPVAIGSPFSIGGDVTQDLFRESTASFQSFSPSSRGSLNRAFLNATESPGSAQRGGEGSDKKSVEYSLSVLKRKLASTNLLRIEAQGKDIKIRQLERKVNEFEQTKARLEKKYVAAKEEFDQYKAEREALEEHGRSKLTDAQAKVRKLETELADTRRALHVAQQTNAVAAKKASIADEARIKIEKEAQKSQTESREQVFSLTAENQRLRETAQSSVSAKEELQRALAVKDTLQARIQQLESKAAELQTQAKKSAELEHLVAEARARHQAATAELQDMADQLECEKEAREKEAQSRQEEQRLRKLAEERANTLGEQMKHLLAGNNSLQKRQQDMEALRAQVGALKDSVVDKNRSLRTAYTQVEEISEDLKKVKEESAIWNKAIQEIHRRIVNCCVMPQQMRKKRGYHGDSKEGVYEDQGGSQSMLAPEELARVHALPAVLGTLDHLHRIQTQLVSRTHTLSDEVEALQNLSEEQEVELERLKAAVAQSNRERNELQTLSVQNERFRAQSQQDIANANKTLSALSQELEMERKENQLSTQMIRRALLRAYTSYFNTSPEGIFSSAQPEWSLEQLVEQVSQALEEKGNNSIAAPVSAPNAQQLRRDEQMNDEWKCACLLLAAANQALQDLVATLYQHKSLLQAFSQYSYNILRIAQSRISKVLKERNEDGEEFWDRPTHPGTKLLRPRSMRSVVLAVIAVRRFRRLAGSPSSKKQRLTLEHAGGLVVNVKFQGINWNAIPAEPPSKGLAFLSESQILSNAEKVPLVMRFLAKAKYLESHGTPLNHSVVVTSSHTQSTVMLSSLDSLCEIASSKDRRRLSTERITSAASLRNSSPPMPNPDAHFKESDDWRLETFAHSSKLNAYSPPSLELPRTNQDRAANECYPSIVSPAAIEQLKEEKVAAEQELNHALFLLSQQLSPDRAPSPR